MTPQDSPSRRSAPGPGHRHGLGPIVMGAVALAVAATVSCLVATVSCLAMPADGLGRAKPAGMTVSLTSFPASSTTATTASFGWATSSTATAMCTLDGATAACTSPRAYSGLAVGSHAFRVTAASATGSASATYSWTITPPTGTAQWTGDDEEGTLADWYAPSASATGDYGGGEYDSGSGVTTSSSVLPHTGLWSQKMSLKTGIGGTRMFRWRELRANRTTRQSAWMYIPRKYTLTGDAATGRYWILYEFKSRLADGSNNQPFWYVNAYNRSNGTMGARLAWGYQSRLEGPHKGELGWRNYGDVTLPIGRWFQISSTLTQSKDFDGAVSISVDGQPLADLTNVRTGQPNCTYNAWCVEQHWAVTNYSDGIAETPSDIYADDARVSTP